MTPRSPFGNGFLLPPEPIYADRRDAGRALARHLSRERGAETVVVGLVRGGVVVAAEVARSLEAKLDVVAVRKVGHPFQPEYALGAVAPGGIAYVRAYDDLPEERVAAAVADAQVVAEHLDARLHAGRAPVPLDGASAVLVDDGLATGATMVAAIRWARARGARRVVAAVPVAAADTARIVEAVADTLVCPNRLVDFLAVGFWYRRFGQVRDDDILALLGTPQAPAQGAGSP